MPTAEENSILDDDVRFLGFDGERPVTRMPLEACFWFL